MAIATRLGHLVLLDLIWLSLLLISRTHFLAVIHSDPNAPLLKTLVRTDDYIASRAFLIMDLICLYPLVDPANADRSEKGRFIWSQHVNFGITLGTPHTDGLSGWSPNNEKLVRFARDSSGFFLLQLSLRVADDERPSILPTLLLLVLLALECRHCSHDLNLPCGQLLQPNQPGVFNVSLNSLLTNSLMPYE
jgi:hypothetical protein